MKSKVLFLFNFGLAAWLFACGPSQAQIETAIAQTQLAAATNTPDPTDTPRPTNTPADTSTPKPSNTPRPTNTPVPTDTATAIPTPTILTGRGDTVVDIEPVEKRARLAFISYAGGGNFSIWNYDANGEKIDLLVNTIGKYSGTVPIDLDNDNPTTRLEITASGDWTIEIHPMLDVRKVTIPGEITGVGDDVVFLDGGDTDLMKVDASKAKGNFSVWAYGASRDLLVNEIAPYTGTVVMAKDVILLVIHAEKEWSIEVTTK
jgi:hypothetical protein